MLCTETGFMVIVWILQLEERERLKVIIMLRQWWSERNRVREGEKMRSVDDLIYVVEKNAAEFQNFPAVNTRRSVQKWKRPMGDVIKINAYGGFMAQSGGGGWGYIIRDSRGDVICAGAGKLRHLREAIRFEVRACYEGEKLAAASRGIGCDTPDKLPHLDTNYQGQFI